MDLSTIANLAEAFAVIVAVGFGMVQLRQLNAQMRREAAVTLMHSIQSPQTARPTRWEWFQWLAERMPEGESDTDLSRPTFTIANGRAFLSLSGRG